MSGHPAPLRPRRVHDELCITIRTTEYSTSPLHTSVQELGSCDVLTVEDAEGLLQGLDLLLSASDAVLVADPSVNARWLQLLVVCERGIKLLLRAIEVGPALLECLLLVLLLATLVLDVLGLLGLVDGGGPHELVVLLLS